MNISMQQRKSSNVILIVLLTLLTLLGGCALTQNSDGPLLEGTLLVKGKITKITTQADITIIKIKPPQGEAVIVQVTPATKLGNLKSIQEIVNHTPVEVNYRMEGADNIAVKLRILEEGACS